MTRRCSMYRLGFLAFAGITFALFPPQQTRSQIIPHATITGRVLDDSTGLPLPLTNVFVSNSTIGTAVDSDGKFRLRNIALGNQQIVASLVGYAAQTISLHMVDTVAYNVVFRLRQQPVQVGGVQVEATVPREWRENLKIFLKEFLGTGPNAGQCKVLNPEVLDFAIGGTGMFTATARGPLEIDNLAIGYHMRCFLNYFSLSETSLASAPKQSREPKQTPRLTPADAFSPRTYAPPPVPVEPLAPTPTQTTMELLCQTRFTPLESRDDKELARWKENRRMTYMGSLRHFLTSLVQRTSKKEKFEVETVYSHLHGEPVWTEVDTDTLLSPGPLEFERILSFSGSLRVAYEAADETEKSTIRLSQPRVIVYTNGMLADPLSITTYGYWATEREADVLPTDFKIDD